MPYKDPDKKKAYDKKYHLLLNKSQLLQKKKTTANWWKSPKGKYKSHMRQALARGIPWEFTFESWYALWIKSGKWNERSPLGYCMCRYGDVGPYNEENVYIAHAKENKRDAWLNNRICLPNTGLYYKDLNP